ncbi:MAG: hypothetical protein ACI82Z_001395 [Cellvibrionaceae bacterium]
MRAKTTRLALLIISAVSPSVLAQDPGVITAGRFDLIPRLTVEYFHDSNLYLAEQNVVSTDILAFSPSLQILFDDQIHPISLTYTLQDATHASRETEDYTDELIDITAALFPDELHRVDFSLSLEKSHDERGEDSISGIPDNLDESSGLDEYDSNTAELTYSGEFIGSILGVQLNLREQERRYTTNLKETGEFDLDESGRNILLYWNVAPTVQLILNRMYTESRYPSGDGSDETIRSIGLGYQPYSFLALDVELGQTETEQLSGTASKEDSWDIVFVWLPLSYSSVTVSSTNTVEESLGGEVGGIVVSQANGISWSHLWTDDFRTTFDVSNTAEDHSPSRKDDVTNYGAEFSYQFRRWLALSLFLQNEERTSSGNNVEQYQQDIYGLRVVMTL